MTAWVDANILLRFLTKTPPELADRARRLLNRAEAGAVTLRVHPLVIAEVVWVLRSYYEYPKARIADEVVRLLESGVLRVQEADAVVAALYGMSEHNVDFVDVFLAETARMRNEAIASLDGDFNRLHVRRIEV